MLVVVMLVGLGADLWSKQIAFATIAGEPVLLSRTEVLARTDLSDLIPFHEPRHAVPGLLDFSLVLNRGAVFGIGAGKRWFFITFTIGALGFGVWMFGSWTGPRDLGAHVGIGLLLAGGLGNLYDRMIYACVRDFIHPLPGVVLPFGWRVPGGGREIWPYVSNVADLFLIIGIGLLMMSMWRKGRAADQLAKAREEKFADASEASESL